MVFSFPLGDGKQSIAGEGTPEGTTTIPNQTLDCREAEVIQTDHAIGLDVGLPPGQDFANPSVGVDEENLLKRSFHGST